MATIPQTQGYLKTGPGTLAILQRSLKTLLSLNPRFLFGLAMGLFILALGFLGPIIFNRTNPTEIVGLLYDPPSAKAWLGTDNFGRDVFTQLMYGIRTSLIIGSISGTVAILIGVLIGTVEPLRLTRSDFDWKLEVPGRARGAHDLGAETFEKLERFYTTGPDELREFVGEGPILTDDHPIIEYFLSLPRDRDPDFSQLKKGDFSRLVGVD